MYGINQFGKRHFGKIAVPKINFELTFHSFKYILSEFQILRKQKDTFPPSNKDNVKKQEFILKNTGPNLNN